jgi:hypothetical protein
MRKSTKVNILGPAPLETRARARALERERILQRILRMKPKKGKHWKDRLSREELEILAEAVRELAGVQKSTGYTA